MQDFVGPDHLARFVLSLGREEVDLAKITGTCGSEQGQPPVDPTMMTALQLYACCAVSTRRAGSPRQEQVDFTSTPRLLEALRYRQTSTGGAFRRTFELTPSFPIRSESRKIFAKS